MNKICKFFSSGGLGDAYIVWLKIHNQKCDEIVWDHASAHVFHHDSITELMALLPNARGIQCHVSPKSTRAELVRSLTTADTIRLNTVARIIADPFDVPFKFVPQDDEAPYVVLQTAAGRNDNSFRYFAPTAILNMAQFFIERGYESVFLGGEFKAPTPTYVHNRAGRTSVWEALNILKGSSYFIGHDGFLAYAAMSMKVPATVIFHDPTLPYHYMHKKWEKRTDVILGSQKIENVKNILERVSL